MASGPLEGEPLGRLAAAYGEALVGRATVARYGREPEPMAP